MNTKKIKSDGGSSSYYDLPLSDKLVQKINQRMDMGQAFIKTEEIIQEVFGNDFSFGCLFKSTVRAKAIEDGGGKEGNDMGYEVNKITYYANKIEEDHRDND